MFANFTKIRPNIIADCETYVLRRRARIANIYQAVEAYIAANNIIVSTQMQLTTDSIVRPYIYDLFTTKCIHHAMGMANIIAEHTPYVQVATILPHRLIRITADCVLIATFRNLPGMDKSPDADAFALVPVKLQYVDAQAFAPEIELIEIYHRLYTIQGVADWPVLSGISAAMLDTISFIDGGFIKKKHKGNRGPHESHQADSITKLFAVLEPFSIFIGTSAMHILYNKHHTRVQCIATIGLTKIIKLITQTMGARYTLKNSAMSIPYDNRLQRLVIVHDKSIVGEVYNCAKYEQIPVVRHNGKIVGTQYVLLRFAFIELFLLRLLVSIGALPKQSADHLRANTLRNIFKFRDAGGNFTTDYVGIYADFQLHCRKVRQQSHISRYEPAIYNHINGHYNTM